MSAPQLLSCDRGSLSWSQRFLLRQSRRQALSESLGERRCCLQAEPRGRGALGALATRHSWVSKDEQCGLPKNKPAGKKRRLQTGNKYIKSSFWRISCEANRKEQLVVTKLELAERKTKVRTDSSVLKRRTNSSRHEGQFSGSGVVSAGTNCSGGACGTRFSVSLSPA